MNEDIFKHLGDCVRDGRKEQDMTQQQLADQVGHGLRHIQRIEKGEVNPSFEVLYSLIHYLGLSAEFIFYPDMEKDEKEIHHLQAKLAACTEQEQQFLIKTLDYMASQFLSQHEAQSTAKDLA